MLRKQPLELVNVSGCCHTRDMEKKMGTYFIVSGESYYVRANSEEEAEAVFNVGMGYMDESNYPDFDIDGETAFERIEYGEAYTTIESIVDFSVSG